MNFWELLLIGFSLCFDSLALAITCGLQTRTQKIQKMFQTAIIFASVQATTPLIGYFAGIILEHFIKGVDHWIAFGLLSFIGGKMIFDSIKERKKKDDTSPTDCKDFTLVMLITMGIATSIDALMVGVTFAFLEVNIWIAAIVFWITTFGVVIIGFLVGNRVGNFFKNGAEILGGVILIGLGLRILFEDLLL